MDAGSEGTGENGVKVRERGGQWGDEWEEEEKHRSVLKGSVGRERDSIPVRLRQRDRDGGQMDRTSEILSRSEAQDPQATCSDCGPWNIHGATTL